MLIVFILLLMYVDTYTLNFTNNCKNKPFNDVIMSMLKNKKNIIELPPIDTMKSYGIHYIKDIKTIPYLVNLGYYNDTYSRYKIEYGLILDFKYKHKFVL